MKTETNKTELVIDSISDVFGGWDSGYYVEVSYHHNVNGVVDCYAHDRISIDRDIANDANAVQEYVESELSPEETDYSEYTAQISSDPSAYGDVTAERAAEIAETLANMIRSEFPGIEVNTQYAIGSASTTGPDAATAREIDNWISENWTSAL